jgi:DNA-binding response OmpR family regulator
MGTELGALFIDKGDLWVVDMAAVPHQSAAFLQALAQLQPVPPLLVVVDHATLGDLEADLEVLIRTWTPHMDVLIRPYPPAELGLRLVQLARERNRAEPNESRYAVGPLIVDLDHHRVTVSGCEAELTPSEFGVLRLLVAAHGSVVSKGQLATALREEGAAVEPHVSRLRQKLVAMGLAPTTIRALRGVGYRLDVRAPDSNAHG